MSKDELRAQVERLERANVALRARNRELRRAAGEAADRIAQLESEFARRQGRAARPTVSRGGGGARRRPAAGAPDRDPGDAVPSGVAAQEPQPLSEADQKVLEHLNEELAPE